MLFSRDKDDDDDFVPNPNYHSNLASIFGNAGSGGENNSSLTYTPPKQPKRQNKPSTIAAPSSSTRSSSLLCAKTVQTFKMVNGEYQNQGKVGAAVLSFGSEVGTSYQILLYRDKQNHLCNAKILREFDFHIQPKNYCTFYDKLNTIWSILFDSPADMAEFTLQVAKCRWKAEQSTKPILIQDLWCPIQSGEGSAGLAASGDSVELTYTLATIDDQSEEMGQSQRVVVQVEASGWKQALVGVQLNTQRVIILQPFMLGDLNPNEAVYKSPVVVKFTVIQVTKASKVQPPTIPPVEEVKNQVTEASTPEPSILGVAEQKVPESPRSPKSTKVELINRMARMGQALPFKTVPTPSDSDETESCSQDDHKSPMHRLNKVVPKPRTRVQHAALPVAGGEGENSSIVPPTAVPAQVPVQWASGIQPYMVGNMYPVPQMNSPMESHPNFNMFLSEVRTTNSELRMGITRLTDKVDTLNAKVDESKKAPPSLEMNSVLEKLMEGEKQLKDQLQLVLTTLQNTQLASQNRASVDSSAQPTASAPDTVGGDPCQECARLLQANVALSDSVKKLQEENEVLQISVTAQKDALFNAKIADKDQLSQIDSLRREVSEEQRNNSELKNSLESLQRVKEILTDDLQTANNCISELQDTLREKQTSIDRLEDALKDSEATKLEEVRRNLQEVLDPRPIIEEHIKKISNAVYRMVKVQFEPQTTYDANFIQSVLAETIKAVTLQYLQNGDLVSSEQRKAAPKGQSKSDSCDQTKSGDLKTPYVVREPHSTTDVECRSSNFTISSQQSSKSSIDSQSQNMSEDKEIVAVESLAEVKLNGLNEKADIVDNNNSAKLGTPASAVDTTEDSSDDDQSLISEKLERVLLHIAQSQSKLVDGPLPSSPSTSTPLSWPLSREGTQVWRPQPPPPPLFEDEEPDDDWLNS